MQGTPWRQVRSGKAQNLLKSPPGILVTQEQLSLVAGPAFNEEGYGVHFGTRLILNIGGTSINYFLPHFLLDLVMDFEWNLGLPLDPSM